MEHEAAKRREKDDDDGSGSGSGSGSDIISQLPESVLHHILCFLSHKKAVQTSVLSKSWRHLGPTRPVIKLLGACDYNYDGHVREINGVCENCFDGNKEGFVSVLEQTFQRYHEHNIFPQELRLDMFMVVHSQLISVLEKWIPIIFIKPNACVVNAFHISSRRYKYFDLPLSVFKVESIRELHLEGCRLKDDIISIDNLMLNNLQKLTLSGVHISDEALEKVISVCPSVKSLFIDYCWGLFTVNIGNKNPYLSYFHISCCCMDKNGTSISINAPTLESIRIESGCSDWYPNKSNYFPHLKSLFLSHVRLSTELFHNISCNFFPSLQELTLIHCSRFEEIKLSSCSIKRLIVHGYCSFQNMDIEVPNILYFELSNGISPITLSLATTSKEWKSHLNLDSFLSAFGGGDKDFILPRIHKLFGLVKAVSQSQISLTLSETLNFKLNHIQWDFNDHPVVVQHLDLNISTALRLDSLSPFLNILFRIFRPRYMRDKGDKSDEEVTKFMWKTLIHEREKTEYGWEQHLEEVSIEASDENEIVWHHVEGTCLPEWSENQKIRFRLKWKDYLDY